MVSPSLEDPLVTQASEAIGGPVGEHAAPHPWWTPVRVVLAVAAVAWMFALVQKAPCVADEWSGDKTRYAKLCYSDVPYLYTGRGFAELEVPFTDNGGRYTDLEYPVTIGYFAFGGALVTHALNGFPDLAERASLPAAEIYRGPGVLDESHDYFLVTAVLLAPFMLLAAWFLAGTHPGRPYDALGFAAAPMLVFTGLINWDLLSVAAVAGALWAWARGRPVLTGVLIGLGTATKLYPMFLLGAILVSCLRRRDLGRFLVTTAAAALGWLAMNLPAMVFGFEHWKTFWRFNSDRGADLGSLWLVWQQAGHPVTSGQINIVSWGFFLAVCVGVLVLGLRAPQTPRVAQLGFLILLGFLLVNKVYSPQYVLWLLPLAVLARPRWRDLLIWQAGELFYFVAVWFYLGGYTAPGGSGQDHVYWLAIVVRTVAQLYFAAMVVRDVLRPEYDPVEQELFPAEPPLVKA